MADVAGQTGEGSAGGDKPLLAFVHIPRTGGGTVSSAISKNYARLRGAGNYQKSPESVHTRLQNVVASPGLWQAVGDHVPYGLFLKYLAPDTRYITILRDPVDRVLSHYHFHAQAGKSGSGGKVRRIWEQVLSLDRAEREGGEGEEIELAEDVDLSLEEGLRRKIPIYDNFMTRFLWGGESLFGELPSDAAERAKDNLESFWFVGITERLNDSIIMLGRQLGIGLMPYRLRHVSSKRPPLEETSDELRRLVAEHNAMDVEVYEFARRRFEEATPPPEDLAEEVEELKRLSVAVTAEGDAHQAGRGKRQAAKREAREAREQRRAAVRAERATRPKTKTRKRAGTESAAKDDPAD